MEHVSAVLQMTSLSMVPLLSNAVGVSMVAGTVCKPAMCLYCMSALQWCVSDLHSPDGTHFHTSSVSSAGLPQVQSAPSRVSALLANAVSK